MTPPHHPHHPHHPHPPHLAPASVEIGAETETAQGWSYEVTLRRGPSVTTHTVTLRWVDHDHWSGGRTPPSRVVQTVLEYTLTHDAAPPWPSTFDAARTRRWLPRIDAEVRAMI